MPRSPAPPPCRPIGTPPRATCTGTLAGHTQFRVRANFCITSNCCYGYGPWVSFGGGTSSVTSGGYTTAADTDVQFR